MIKYKRILLKLSGESLSSGKETFDNGILNNYCNEIKEIVQMGVEVGIVVGGGNIFRGLKGINKGFDRVKGDYMGMLATVINGIAIEIFLKNIGQNAKVLTAISIEPFAERYTKQKALSSFTNKEVVIFTAGTGNPFFTTDTAAALRAVETDCDVLIKGTRVDGVYSADPEKDPKATKFDEITFNEAYQRGLNIMDLTAFTMCKESNLPVIVFDINKQGALKKMILGEKIGTLVKN